MELDTKTIAEVTKTLAWHPVLFAMKRLQISRSSEVFVELFYGRTLLWLLVALLGLEDKGETILG
jgi:hypothetical protein